MIAKTSPAAVSEKPRPEGEIGDEEGGPAALADRKAGAGEGEARQPRRAPQRGERAGEVLRTEERARRQRLMAAVVGVDARAQRLHEGDRRDDDGGREDERRAPARRLGDRRQRHAGEDAADRNAGLLDREDEVAVAHRRVALEHVAAGGRRGAVAEPDQEACQDRRREEGQGEERDADAAEPEPDLQRPDRAGAADERVAGEEEGDRAEGRHRGEIADRGLGPAELGHDGGRDRRDDPGQEGRGRLKQEGRDERTDPGSIYRSGCGVHAAAGSLRRSSRSSFRVCI